MSQDRVRFRHTPPEFVAGLSKPTLDQWHGLAFAPAGGLRRGGPTWTSLNARRDKAALVSKWVHTPPLSLAQLLPPQETLMGMVMIRCPETGREVSTGMRVDHDSFRATPVFFARSFCPICNTEHEWFAQQAWICDGEPNREDALS
jgi:hypothetical protein